MPTSVGPNTFGEENLVFAFDTGDTVNSYKGEPTENLFPTPLDLSEWNTPSDLQITPNADIAPDGTSTAVKIDFYDTANLFGPSYNRTLSGATAGRTFTISFWEKDINSQALEIYNFSPSLEIYVVSPVTGSTQATVVSANTNNRTPGTGWTYRECVYQIAQNDATAMYIRPYRESGGVSFTGETGSLFIWHPQLEEKDHATQFVNGTRSATQGLLDLTGNSTLNLTNVSFDSNAQMTFDGTDDLLDTNLFSGRNPSTDPFTVEAVLKADTTSGARLWIDASGNGIDQRFYSSLDDGGGNPLGISGSAYGDSAPNTTDWTHQTIVMDGTTARSYRNGVATYTKEYGSYTLSGDIIIGGRNGYNWSGDIALVKIYNRALTASEIKSNFNAIKGRFNI